MTLEDEYKLLVSGYYGISEMDEYNLKEYILNDLEKYIKEFVKEYHITWLDLKQVAQEVEKRTLKEKLQDSLLILNKVNAPLELYLLIRNRLNDMKK